jgi:hypothetical protein
LNASTYNGTSLAHVRRLRLPDDWVADGDAPVSLCTRRFMAYVGLGSQLTTLSGEVFETIRLAGRQIRSVTALEGSDSYPLAVAMEVGGIVIWPPFDGPRIEPFAEDLTNPVIEFTRGGWLMAADETAIESYRLNLSDQHVTWHATWQQAEGPPPAALIAILTAAHEDQFALLMANGSVQLFSLPRHG